jgi:hypothetical protein
VGYIKAINLDPDFVEAYIARGEADSKFTAAPLPATNPASSTLPAAADRPADR